MSDGAANADPLELLAKAVGRTRTTIADVAEAQLGSATPCAEWDVCGLMNHMLGGLEFTAGCMAGSPPDLRPTEADSSLAGQRDLDTLIGAYENQSQRLLRMAAEPGMLDRIVASPFGEMPAARFLVGTVMDQTIHFWDLAKATGQDASLSHELVEYTMLLLSSGFAEQGRAMGLIGPEIAVLDGSSEQDKLIAFMGRQP
jgi:uncharacterized protein (TIGR03086 family)